jgi:hypothetical protein
VKFISRWFSHQISNARLDRGLPEILMRFRILFDEDKLKQGIYQQDEDWGSEKNGTGWPRGTWFQKRLRQVRDQQRRKQAETDFVYECALGTIIIRQSNGTESPEITRLNSDKGEVRRLSSLSPDSAIGSSQISPRPGTRCSSFPVKSANGRR